MEKTNVNTALAIFFLATAVMLIGGLAVIPVIEEAQERGSRTTHFTRRKRESIYRGSD
jgi:hypothetical protein